MTQLFERQPDLVGQISEVIAKRNSATDAAKRGQDEKSNQKQTSLLVSKIRSFFGFSGS